MSIEKVFMNKIVADVIIKHLSLSDVKNAALVCRSWRQQVECRQYWRRATLRIRDEAIFSSPRIQSVRRFKLDSSDTDTELVCLFFSFISDNTDYDVEYLKCDTLTLNTVAPTQLATSLCKIAEVELLETKLSNRQHHYLFRDIGQSPILKLRKLVLEGLPLDRVDPEILAMAITKVEEITLSGVQLMNTIHMNTIFRVLRQSKSKLKKLEIHSTCEIMEWVRDVDSMAQALCKVQDVELNFWFLSTDQLEVIFRNISTTSELHLQTLTINNVSEVSPEILASAVCRLRRFTLCCSVMTSEQLEELCREIVISKNLPLAYLKIENTPELEYVEADVLASAVVRLEVVEMVDYTTVAQFRAILGKVVECNDSKLKELYVDYVDAEEPETKSLLLKVKDKVKIFEVDELWSSDYGPKQVIV